MILTIKRKIFIEKFSGRIDNRTAKCYNEDNPLLQCNEVSSCIHKNESICLKMRPSKRYTPLTSFGTIFP